MRNSRYLTGLIAALVIGGIHGTCLAAGDYTRRLLDLEPRRRRGFYPKGWDV